MEKLNEKEISIWVILAGADFLWRKRLELMLLCDSERFGCYIKFFYDNKRLQKSRNHCIIFRWVVIIEFIWTYRIFLASPNKYPKLALCTCPLDILHLLIPALVSKIRIWGVRQVCTNNFIVKGCYAEFDEQFQICSSRITDKVCYRIDCQVAQWSI